jgi:hypothetical protein
MNMVMEPTTPMMKEAGQIIAMIILKASTTGLCRRSWAAVSRMMFRMTKRTIPRTDVKRRIMNCLAVLQGWTNARTKAIAARKAKSMPGGLSLIPTTAAAIVNKPQITRRIKVLILLRDVLKESNMTVSFFDVYLTE